HHLLRPGRPAYLFEQTGFVLVSSISERFNGRANATFFGGAGSNLWVVGSGVLSWAGGVTTLHRGGGQLRGEPELHRTQICAGRHGGRGDQAGGETGRNHYLAGGPPAPVRSEHRLLFRRLEFGSTARVLHYGASRHDPA